MGQSLIFLLVFLPTVAFAGEVIKDNGNCEQIPNGSICYDEKSQVQIDEALDLGVECQRNLAGCRKWRNKYKALLDQEDYPAINQGKVVVPQLTHEWTKITWLKFGVASLVAFGIGFGVGFSL